MAFPPMGGTFNSNGSGWLRKQLTFDRILLIVVLIFQLGQWLERQRTTNTVLAGKLDMVSAQLTLLDRQDKIDNDRADLIYARKDVIESELKAIHAELAYLTARGQKDR